MAKLSSQLEAVRKSQDALNEAILENPSKALSVPMIRRDLDTLDKNYREGIQRVREEVERMYDLNKWFIGLMFTMALGVLGLAIGNFIQAKKSD